MVDALPSAPFKSAMKSCFCFRSNVLSIPVVTPAPKPNDTEEYNGQPATNPYRGATTPKILSGFELRQEAADTKGGGDASGNTVYAGWIAHYVDLVKPDASQPPAVTDRQETDLGPSPRAVIAEPAHHRNRFRIYRGIRRNLPLANRHYTGYAGFNECLRALASGRLRFF